MTSFAQRHAYLLAAGDLGLAQDCPAPKLVLCRHSVLFSVHVPEPKMLACECVCETVCAHAPVEGAVFGWNFLQLSIQSVACSASTGLMGQLLGRAGLPPDLLNQNLHFNELPR